MPFSQPCWYLPRFPAILEGTTRWGKPSPVPCRVVGGGGGGHSSSDFVVTPLTPSFALRARFPLHSSQAPRMLGKPSGNLRGSAPVQSSCWSLWPKALKIGTPSPSSAVVTCMTREIVSRVAGNLVKEFGHEKHFALSLPRRRDLELMAESLSTEYGCLVMWHDDANKIAVRCPDKRQAMVL